VKWRVTHIKLRTLCGCTQVMDIPFPNFVPDKWVAPLPARAERMSDVPDLDSVETFPRRRVFQWKGKEIDLGDGDVMLIFEEIDE
jgi:hypothetical protein